MKYLILLLFTLNAYAAGVEISQLPLASAAATGTNDSFPFVNSTTDVTERLTLYDLVNVPAFVSTYAPLSSPIFTGTVTAPTFSGALTGTASGNLTYTANNHGAVLSGTGNAAHVLAPSASTTAVLVSGGTSADPGWGSVALASAVSGQLPTANGGTGLNAPTAHGVLVGEGSSNVSPLVGGAGTLFQGNGSSSDPTATATPTLGVNGTTSGTLSLATSTASGGSVTIANGGTTSGNAWTFTLPAIECTSGQVLSSSGNSGAWSCATVAVFSGLTPNAIMYATSSSTIASVSSAGTSGQVMTSNGPSSAPTMQTVPGNSTVLKAPTVQTFTATGTQTGWLFTISTSTTCAVGDTYTNNGNTYTVQGALSAASGQVLFMSGTGATSGTTLTRATGSGTSSITFSATVATASYTVPSSPAPLYQKVRAMGGGGGGGASGSTRPSGATGNTTWFGTNIITLLGGGGGNGGTSGSGAGGTGGTGSVTASANVILLALVVGSSASGMGSYVNSDSGGTAGGTSPFGGSGGGGKEANGGIAAQANSGSGGGGAGGVDGVSNGGTGGGSGCYAEVIFTGLTGGTVIPYIVGTGGGGGSGSSASGGNGAAGQIIIEEHYQ